MRGCFGLLNDFVIYLRGKSIFEDFLLVKNSDLKVLKILLEAHNLFKQIILGSIWHCDIFSVLNDGVLHLIQLVNGIKNPLL